jgi:hypothetical protein
MIHTPFCVGRGVLAEPGNGHDELPISRTIMSSAIRIAMAGRSVRHGAGAAHPEIAAFGDTLPAWPRR